VSEGGFDKKHIIYKPCAKVFIGGVFICSEFFAKFRPKKQNITFSKN
jgi:hypothetical protein